MRKIRDVLRLKYELGFTHRTIAKGVDLIFTMVSTTYRHTIAGM